MLGQFHTYLEFRGEKYLSTFIVTNANDCSNLLSYGATFRMRVLLPNYPEENVVKGDNVPNFSEVNTGRTGNGTAHGTSYGMQHGITYASTGCFKGMGHFPGEPYKFHLKPEHKPPRHAPRKVPIHLEAAFKEEIDSLVKLGILEEVKEHTDWVNSYVTVEKDSENHHSPNHSIKRKLRICLDPRDLNEALEREGTLPYMFCG